MFKTLEISFTPLPEDFRFYSMYEGVKYAQDAGFKVIVDDGAYKASRRDMIKKIYILQPDRDKPERFVWVEM